MEESDFIKNLKELRQIKPEKDWVVFTKKRILGQELPAKKSFFWQILLGTFLKPAIITAACFGFIFGSFTLVKSSLPGDILYPIKRIAEKSRAIFVSESEKPRLDLEFANKRLEELNTIARSNQVKRLAPAISEFQADVAEAAGNLSKVKKINQNLVDKTRKLEQNKEKVEKVLATKIETKEYDNALAELVERELKKLEERALGEDEMKILAEAKTDYGNKNYTGALEKLLLLSYPQP